MYTHKMKSQAAAPIALHVEVSLQMTEGKHNLWL